MAARTPRAAKPHESVSGIVGFSKRTLDIAVSSLALVVLFPLYTIVAASIRLLDGSPVFYQQIRVGLGGKRFTIYKFRTMGNDAESGGGPVWSLRKDQRPTRLGTLLRRTGFDELPQLLNVLKGEMSLVGPRPERPVFVESFEREFIDYNRRHAVKPGLTGYAQVHGWRGATDLGRRLDHDLHYVRNYSIALDLYILLATLIWGWSEATRDGLGG